MNKIEQLISKLCPNGVEFKRLGDIGEFYSGLKGKSKEAFLNGNKQYVPYTNIFNNAKLDFNALDNVYIGEQEEQNAIELGDVFFTGSSETPEECAMSCVVTEKPKEDIYLNSFCFGFRFSKIDLFNLDFLKHYFRSYDFRKNILTTINGTMRFNVSKKLFQKLPIPVPPIEIQEEIVKILDNFSELKDELIVKLTSEFTARKKQYEYYRNTLLDFGDENNPKDNVEFKTLGEVGTFIRGMGLSKSDLIVQGIGCIHYGEIHTYYKTYTYYTNSFVSLALSNKLRKAKKGNLIIAGVSENCEDICKAVAYLGDEEICISGDSFAFSHEEDPKFIAYLFQTHYFAQFKRQYAYGTKVIRLSIKDLANFKIPVPPLETQQKIVNILDQFEALTTDYQSGLPAEIEARNKQYEYYRNRLLTFKELKSVE